MGRDLSATSWVEKVTVPWDTEIKRQTIKPPGQGLARDHLLCPQPHVLLPEGGGQL